MTYLGDFAADSTFDCKFCTVTTTGAPTQLAGTPVVSAYIDNSTTQITAGITLSVDFDSITGLNNVRVVATGANGYTAGSNFQLVITTGTVGGTSVVGYVIAQFSITARSALRPTTAGRTLDVSAGGEAGLDWANIGSPTTAQNLSGTNIDVDQVVASVSGAVGSVTGAVGSVTGNVGGNVTGSVGSVVGAVGSVTGNVGGNVVGTVASVVGNVGGNVVGTVASVVGNVGGDLVGDVQGNVDGSVGSIGVGGIDSMSFAAGAIDAAALAQDALDAVSESVLAYDWDGFTGEADRSVLNALRFLRNKWGIAAGTLTVTKEDDSTTAWTGAVTTAASDPVTAIDPA